MGKKGRPPKSVTKNEIIPLRVSTRFKGDLSKAADLFSKASGFPVSTSDLIRFALADCFGITDLADE